MARLSRANEPIAKRWAAEMKRAMAAKKMSQQDVANEMNCQQSWINRYAKGHTIPMLDRAKRLSEILDSERLLALAKEWARRDCIVCGKTFYTSNLQMKQVYCNTNCKNIAARDAKREKARSYAKLNAERLKMYRECVGQFCDDCTAGDGACHDQDCPLRPISPLPYIPAEGYRHSWFVKNNQPTR